MKGERRHSLVVVLPCYNEEANIETLVKHTDTNCLHLNYSIVAVDDGSKDQTRKILTVLRRDFPIVLLKHPQNLGLQAALTTGLQKALQLVGEEDYVVVMDADLTHDPCYIRTMVSWLSAGYDLVIGSRYVEGGTQIGVPLHRLVLSRGINIFSKYLFRLPVKDVTSGFRCYKANVLKKVVDRYGPDFIESKGFEIAFELLVKTHRLKAKMTEIPIVLNYSKKKSRSKLRIQRTVYDYLRLMTKLCVQSCRKRG